jgi:hypothetical protein
MIERVFILRRTDLFKELPSEVLASFANHLEEIYVGEPMWVGSSPSASMIQSSGSFGRTGAI